MWGGCEERVEEMAGTRCLDICRGGSRCRVALGGAVCLILFQFDVSIGLTSVLIKQQLYVYSWQARIVLCYLLREVKQISDRNGLCVSGDTNTGNIDSLVNSV